MEQETNGTRPSSARSAPTADLEMYFLEHPMALAISHLLSQKANGLTATDLAFELHVSVPTTYRLSVEMWRLGLLDAEKNGRKTMYTVSAPLSRALPELTARAEKVFAKTSSREKTMLGARMIQATYNIPLSARASSLLITSMVKQKVKTLLPGGARPRRIGSLRTVVGEPVKMDMYLGDDQGYVGVEIKVVETPRHLRERVGALASLSSIANPGLKGIIPAYLLSPMGGQRLVDEQAANSLLSFLKKESLNVRPIAKKCSEHDLLDPAFLQKFAEEIVKAYREIDHG